VRGTAGCFATKKSSQFFDASDPTSLSTALFTGQEPQNQTLARNGG
jgi:hypothetical protein